MSIDRYSPVTHLMKYCGMKYCCGILLSNKKGLTITNACNKANFQDNYAE